MEPIRRLHPGERFMLRPMSFVWIVGRKRGQTITCYRDDASHKEMHIQENQIVFRA